MVLLFVGCEPFSNEAYRRLVGSATADGSAHVAIVKVVSPEAAVLTDGLGAGGEGIEQLGCVHLLTC